MNKKEKISIVTICYNAVDTIEETILSVINQTYDNFEYIIVDGSSIDGTINIINRYMDKITFFVSEPDKGIYDAMNKGIKVANGDWIIFMNSGDKFYSDDVVSNVFGNKITGDVIYGNRVSKYPKADYVSCPSDVSELRYRFCLFHQSIFVKTSLMKDSMFDISFRICGDFNFFHKLYIEGKTFTYVDEIISVCDCEDGISNNLKYTRRRIYEDSIIVNGLARYEDYLRIIYFSTAAIIKVIWKVISPRTYDKWRYSTYDKNPFMTRINTK